MDIRKKIAVFSLSIVLLALHITVANSQEDLSLTPVMVPMTLNCDILTGSALEYAEEHNLCPSEGDVYPMDYRSGNCGASWLWIGRAGPGRAFFDIGAQSFLGPMVAVVWNVSWVNWDTFGTGAVGGYDVLLSTNWNKSPADFTGTGYVTATLTGQVQLAWGGTCTFLNPQDAQFIY